MKEYQEYWNGIFDYEGRASMSQYWMPVLFNTIIFFIYMILGTFINTLLDNQFVQSLLSILAFAFLVSNFLAGLSVTIRRLHDSYHSGLWILTLFIPIVGAIWLLILLCYPSTNNQYR